MALALADGVFRPAAPGAVRLPEDLFARVAGRCDVKALATLMTVLGSAGSG